MTVHKIQIYGISCQAHNFNRRAMHGSDDEDFALGAPTPHTTVNCRTHAHLLILFWYYLLTNPDLALTERPAKKAKTVFANLSEDDREIGSRTMPAKLMFDGHSWKCSTRVHSQKDDGWTAYYTCCNTECEARMIVKTTRDFRLVLCNKFAILLVTYFIF